MNCSETCCRDCTLSAKSLCKDQCIIPRGSPSCRAMLDSRTENACPHMVNARTADISKGRVRDVQRGIRNRDGRAFASVHKQGGGSSPSRRVYSSEAIGQLNAAHSA